MKSVLNIFARQIEDRPEGNTKYVFKEPTLDPSLRPLSKPASQAPVNADIVQEKPVELPVDYAGIVAYFHKVVADRKSPYNTLVQSSERLKDFLPDEISRLKAAYAICGDQWTPEIMSMAIKNHIADIDLVHSKARSGKQAQAAEQTAQLKKQAMQLRQEAVTVKTEIDTLNARLEKLQTTLADNNNKIASLDEKIQLFETTGGSVNFIDQAAENLKNDLLAKKVLLGLTAV